MKQAIAIVRASTNEQTNSHELQLDSINRFAQAHSYTIVKVFSSYVSGMKRYADRPVLQEALKYAEENDLVVICYRLDRLSRSLDTFQAIEDSLPRLRFSTQGDCPINLLLASMLLSIAHSESRANSERVKSAYKTLKARHGDRLRWGRRCWNDDTRKKALDAVRTNAASHNLRIAKIVSDLRQAEYSTRQIVSRLNDMNIKTRTGKDYTYYNLLRVLRTTTNPPQQQQEAA